MSPVFLNWRSDKYKHFFSNSCNICELFSFVGKIKVKGWNLQVHFCTFQLLLLEQFSIEKPQIVYCRNRFFTIAVRWKFCKENKLGLTLLLITGNNPNRRFVLSDEANNLKELGLNKSLAAASTHGDGLAAAILFLKIISLPLNLRAGHCHEARLRHVAKVEISVARDLRKSAKCS